MAGRSNYQGVGNDKSNKKWPLRVQVALVGAVAVASALGLVGCDNAKAVPESDPNTANPPIEQPTSPSNSESTSNAATPPDSDSASDNTEQNLPRTDRLPEGIPEPENMNPDHEGFDRVRAAAIEKAQALLRAGESGADGGAMEIKRIVIFPQSEPDGYQIVYINDEGDRVGASHTDRQ
jgi:hypothetical protein